MALAFFSIRRSQKLVLFTMMAFPQLWLATARADEESDTQTESSSADDAAADETDDESTQSTGSEAEGQTAGRDGSLVVRALGRALGSMFGGGRSEEEEELSELVSEPAPPFELESLPGEKISLEDLRGKVVVLDFWATWCGPCMAAMPELQKLHQSFDGQPVAVIGVNQQEERADVEEVVAKQGFQFLQLLDIKGTVGTDYGVSGIPQTVLIDAQGVVQAVHVGYSPMIKSTLTEQIEKLMQGENVYDPVKVEEARKRRQERREKILAKLGSMNAHSLIRLGEVLADPDVSLDNSYRPALWTTFPGAAQQTLTVFTGEKRLITVDPENGAAKVVDLQLDDNCSLWDYCPVMIGDEVRWATLQAEYDDNYDISYHLVLVDHEGKRLWGHLFDKLETDVSSAADVAAGDLTGDSVPEIAIVVDYRGLVRTGITGPDRSTRVLSVFGIDGTRLCQTWVPGKGGAGLHILPSADGNVLLMATNEGLTRFGIDPSAALDESASDEQPLADTEAR